MIKEIKYGGMDRFTSDYDVADGEFEMTYSTRNAGDGLKTHPTYELLLRNYHLPLGIHTPGDSRLLLLFNESEKKMFFIDLDTSESGDVHIFTSSVSKVLTIGNALVVSDTNKENHFLLYTSGGYTYLGTSLPYLNIVPRINTEVFDDTYMNDVFGLQLGDTGASDISGNGYIPTDTINNLVNGISSEVAIYGEMRNNLYSRIFGKINAYERVLRKNGYFTAPFFVRCAYRMYDGTHINATDPVLMVPNSWGTPLVLANLNEKKFHVVNAASQLSIYFDLPEDLTKWKDLISHIDIFVSSPIIGYSDSPESITTLRKHMEIDGEEYVEFVEPAKFMDGYNWRYLPGEYIRNQGANYFVESVQGKYPNRITAPGGSSGYKSVYLAVDISTEDIDFYYTGGSKVPTATNPPSYTELGLPEGQYKIYDYRNTLGLYYYFYTRAWTGYKCKGPKTAESKANNLKFYFPLERVDGKSIDDEIISRSSFYLIEEIQLKSFDYEGFYKDVETKNNTLVNLQVQTVLKNDEIQISKPLTIDNYIYNKRLYSLVQSENFIPSSPLYSQNPCSSDEGEWIERILLEIEENTQTTTIEIPIAIEQGDHVRLNDILYFSYPRKTAKRLLLYVAGDITGEGEPQTYREYELPLTVHDFLNSSYVYNLEPTLIREVNSLPIATNNPIIYGNKLNASNTDNPYIYRNELTIDLPIHKATGMAPVCAPLSEGQYGQFPLYVFSKEGIFAVEFSYDGTYKGVQSAGNYVCTNTKSIAQTGDGVVFATNNSIIMLQGLTKVEISRAIQDKEYNFEHLIGEAKLIDLYKQSGFSCENPIDISKLETFLEDCSLCYDMTNDILHLSNPNMKYSYQYCTRNSKWSVHNFSPLSYINNYTNQYAITRGEINGIPHYELYNISNDDTYVRYPSILITRPLKLDLPDTFKTIERIIQRGNFEPSHVKQILYGSNDLKTWRLLASSVDKYLNGLRGHAYKYFRLALFMNLEEGESLTGCTIQFQPRGTNVLR